MTGCFSCRDWLLDDNSGWGWANPKVWSQADIHDVVRTAGREAGGVGGVLQLRSADGDAPSYEMRYAKDVTVGGFEINRNIRSALSQLGVVLVKQQVLWSSFGSNKGVQEQRGGFIIRKDSTKFGGPPYIVKWVDTIVINDSNSHSGPNLVYRSSPGIGECYASGDWTILDRPRIHNFGISIHHFWSGLQPSSLIVHAYLKLAGINTGLSGVNASLYESNDYESTGKYGHDCRAMAIEPSYCLSQPPRGLLLCLGFLIGTCGLFCLVYVSAFQFYEGRTMGGILCLVTGLLLSLLALFVIHPPQQNLWVDSGSGRRPNV